MKKFLNSIDPSRFIAKHVLGPKYTLTHRKVIGTLLMILGVCGVKIFSHEFDSIIVHIVTDILGYAFHGIGLLPWITGLENLETTSEIVKVAEEAEEEIINKI